MRLRALAIAGLMTLTGLGGMLAMNGTASAVACPDGSQRPSADSLAECNLPPTTANDSLIDKVMDAISVVLGVLGIVAVVVIIIGGISFITSQGDSSKVTKARNTILYGIVGLVIALLAFAIVNFVLKGVFGGTSTP